MPEFRGTYSSTAWIQWAFLLLALIIVIILLLYFFDVAAEKATASDKKLNTTLNSVQSTEAKINGFITKSENIINKIEAGILKDWDEVKPIICFLFETLDSDHVPSWCPVPPPKPIGPGNFNSYKSF